MSDTPHIKRWMEHQDEHTEFNLPDHHDRWHADERATAQAAHDDLAEHIERLEARFNSNRHPHPLTDPAHPTKPFIGTTPPTNTAP